MKKGKRQHGAEFKGRVALEALKGLKTMSELASGYEVHPVQIAKWKKQLQSGVGEIFARRRERQEEDGAALRARLYQQIGQLQVELEWLKKKRDWTVEQKRLLIEPDHRCLSVRRQCQLVGLSRASLYYEAADESPENLKLMRLLDEQYVRTPLYGVARMTQWLRREGHGVNAAEAEIYSRLSTTTKGLLDEQNRERLIEYGENVLPSREPPTLFAISLRQFKSPLIYVLLAAAVVALVLAEYTDAEFIFAVLLLNAGLGAFQEWNAERSEAGLQKLLTPSARVRRDGKELVPGDIVLLESGDRVPADLRLLQENNLNIDESFLMIEQTLVAGLTMAILTFGAWSILMAWGVEESYARNILLLLFVLIQGVHVFNCRSERVSAFGVPLSRNYFLVEGVLAALGLHLACMYFPQMQKILRIGPVTLRECGVLLGLCLVMIVVMDVFKLVHRHSVRNQDSRIEEWLRKQEW